MEEIDLELGEDQLAALGVDAPLLEDVGCYLEDIAFERAGQPEDNDYQEIDAANVAEIIEGSPEQAQAVLQYLRAQAEEGSDPRTINPELQWTAPNTPPDNTIMIRRRAQAPSSPAASIVERLLEAELASQLENSTAAKRDYAAKLALHFRHHPAQKLIEVAVDDIVERFDNWQYDIKSVQREGVTRRVHYLRKIITDESVDLDLPKVESPRRKVVRDKEGVAIQAQEDVIGVDILCLLAIENLLGSGGPQAATELRRETVQQRFAEEAKKFAKAKNVFLHEDDLFTDKESIALSLTTHFKNFEELGTALRVSASTLSRLFDALPARLGLPATGNDASRNLMLIAMVTGIASYDHVPHGRTAGFSKKDRVALANYYDPDLEKRAAYRRQHPPRSRLSRMYDKLGEDGDWHMALVCGVRDDIIKLPTIEYIRSRMPKKT